MDRGYASAVELRADQPLHLAAVGAALRLPHHGADDRADRLPLAGLDLLDRVGVGGDRAIDDLAQLVRPPRAPSPWASTIAAGSPPSAISTPSTSRAADAETSLSATSATSCASAAGSSFVSAGSVSPRAAVSS